MKTRIALYILVGLALIGYIVATDAPTGDSNPGSVSEASIVALGWAYSASLLYYCAISAVVGGLVAAGLILLLKPRPL